VGAAPGGGFPADGVCAVAPGGWNILVNSPGPDAGGGDGGPLPAGFICGNTCVGADHTGGFPAAGVCAVAPGGSNIFVNSPGPDAGEGGGPLPAGFICGNTCVGADQAGGFPATGVCAVAPGGSNMRVISPG
jgi:hypothetical protein